MLGEYLNTQIWNALGYSIMHFLWQGIAIGLFTFLILQWNEKSNATTRHAIACAALLVSIAVFIGTFIISLNTFDYAIASNVSIEAISLTSEINFSNNYSFYWLISFCWIIGICLMLTRYLRQFMWSHHIKSTGTSTPETQWMELFYEIKGDIGIKQTVRFLQSTIADTPMVIGWISPVILVPVSIFTSMPHDQIRAILAHELSHIKRYDHIINFIQALAEVILFFHPAIWWISRQIRYEREHCCDDVTVQTIKQPKILAEALLQLELLRTSQTHKQATLAANGGSLMNRIKRLLLNQNKNQHAWKAPLSIASLALIASISVGASNLQANADDTAKKSPVATVEEEITNARSEFTLKITDALIAGKLTPEDAAQKMISFEEGIVEKMQYLRGIQERIEHAVTSGEMTREEAEAKYSAMLKDKKENPGDARAQAYLKKVGAEIKEAVANGDMTSEEGKAKYAEAEARIEKRIGKKNEGNKRAEVYLAQVGAEIKEAVASGEMTPEEGKAKYSETVKAIAQRMASARSNGKSKQITREGYAQAKAKMLRMVKAGEITREQMQERLDGMKKAMSGGDREEASDRQEEPSDDCMALRRRLGEAVRNGAMTREEAGKIWEDEGC